MNRYTLLWYKSCKMNVLRKIGNQHWFHASRSVLLYAQWHFFKCEITTIIVGNKFWDNSKCKFDQGKAILDGIEFRVSKIIYKDICIKVHGLWGWGLLCASMSLSILRCAIAANAFSSDLKTHKSQTFPMNSTSGSC